MVFYRKYRPQTIEELDSSDVREKLKTILSSRDIPHAFLFTGPKGLGKTSAARIVAKVINCEKRQNAGGKPDAVKSGQTPALEPCNKCSQCISIANGSNVDVIEIDGASNRGIDEIRNLKEKINLSPAAAAKKVYIIDEVHMLTEEAFDALLKTLEEPPTHAVFILCTTESHKIPPTVSSRCFRINFKKATPEELSRSFKRIAKEEKINITDGALSLLAGLSDGSFRDGVKTLEELVLSFPAQKITEELVEEKYKSAGIADRVWKFIEALAEGDIKKSLEILEEAEKEGMDMLFFSQQVINMVHAQILKKAGVESSEEKTLELSILDLRELTYLFEEAHKNIKFSVLPQLPLELAALQWCSEKTPQPQVQEKNFSPEAGDTDLMDRLIEEVKPQNHLLSGVLRGCVLSRDDKGFTIEAKSPFHKERLSQKKSIDIIESALVKILGEGKPVSVSIRESGVREK